MRLNVARASELPAPGAAAVEVMACDLRNGVGRRLVRRVCGKRALRELLRREARFVAIVLGPGGGRAVAEYTEPEFVELGAHLVDFMPLMPGPVVVTHYGLSPQLRDRMIAVARRRDLETVAPAGRA
jgi:hypothetical protein